MLTFPGEMCFLPPHVDIIIFICYQNREFESSVCRQMFTVKCTSILNILINGAVGNYFYMKPTGGMVGVKFLE